MNRLARAWSLSVPDWQDRIRNGRSLGSGAALICVLMFWTLSAFPALAEAVNGQNVTECCFSARFVLVKIRDSAETISGRESPHGNDIAPQPDKAIEIFKNPFRRDFDSHFLTASYAGKCLHKSTLHVYAQLIGDQDVTAHLNHFCGGSAFVKAENGCAEAVSRVARYMSYFYSMNVDFRSVNCGEFFASEPQGFERQSGLFRSGNPEGECEGGDDKRGKCREKSIVSVNETQRADGLGFDDAGDSVAIVFGTIAALLGGILTYAGLKRGCDVVFGPSKNRNGDAA
jgi:hypothetical protein